MNIEPTIGVGEAKLGASPADVETALGPPEEVSSVEDGEIEWTYRKHGVYVCFEKEPEPKVNSITVIAPGSTLFGVPVIGMAEPELFELLRRNHLQVELGDYSDKHGKILIDWASGLWVSTEEGRVNAVTCERPLRSTKNYPGA